MQLSNMLAAWQWAVLAAIPPAIIALYFLKLRRLPLEVPSTYLWRKSLEDLHVNSLWQRLRRSILLLLQLLLIGLLMAALLRPTWEGSTRAGGRAIYLVDNSASMSATDVSPTRLDAARRRVDQMLDQMSAGDQAMIISFAEGARVEQVYTENLGELRRRLAAVAATEQSTSIAEALRVASGLANPGRSGGSEAWDPDFALGNLDAEFIPLGDAAAGNVGVVAFSTRRHDEKAGQLQAFARIENFSVEAASVVAELYLNGERVDAQQLDLPSRGAEGVVFDLGEMASAALELRLDAVDALAVDNRAFAALNEPRRARVLLVTAGNPPLEFALRTERALRLAEVTTQPPTALSAPEFRQAV
jgi:von Willebrand factor type A domain/Aerotolerance regulator N-terminal